VFIILFWTGRTDTRWRENLLQNRSKKKTRKNTKNKKRVTEDIEARRVKSGLHDDALKRVMRHCVAAFETTTSRVFTRSRIAGRISTTMPPKGL
jgi:hypothetical protein